MVGLFAPMMRESIEDLEIAPRDVKSRIARGDAFLFVDVREPWEHDTARIEGSTLIPLREIPAQLGRLQMAREVVLFCHHGVRSMDAAVWLRSQGVETAKSMGGGIDRWSWEIDPLVPRY
jgi:rhodanese-related sulfurtransferase